MRFLTFYWAVLCGWFTCLAAVNLTHGQIGLAALSASLGAFSATMSFDSAKKRVE
jgi:hypothetical protein